MQLIVKLFDIIRLRAGPQDLPASWLLTVLFFLLYMLIGYGGDQLIAQEGEEGSGNDLLLTLINIVIVGLLIYARGVPQRLAQTLNALLGVSLILLPIALTILYFASLGLTGLSWVWLFVFIWSLIVDGSIYRHALGVSINVGVLIAVLIFGFDFLLITKVF